MSVRWEEPSEIPLFEEHMLLGGVFTEEDMLLGPRAYASSGPVEELPQTLLCDLSGLSATLISGGGAEAFVLAACAGEPLAVGELAAQAVLSGDGSLAGAPLLARSGDSEWLVWDFTARGPMISSWLNFLAAIEQDGYKPFAEAALEDVSSSLVPLLLWGDDARKILTDYLGQAVTPPACGQIAQLSLDKIECLVASLDLDGRDAYLLMVPPAMARVLWRSLLSFTTLTPVGQKSLFFALERCAQWAALAKGYERLEPSAKELEQAGLIRRQGGYVGERALFAR